MTRLFTTLALFTFLFSGFAHARIVSDTNACTMQENATLSLNWNGTSPDVKTIKNLVNQRMEKAREFGKEAGVASMELQSQNYNINSQNYGTEFSGYQYSGSASFMVKPSDKAAELLEKLVKNGIQASLSVNEYRQGMCQ